MEKKQLQVTTITSLGRIYLGQKVIARLNAQVGDHVQIIDEGGILRIAKVEA